MNYGFISRRNQQTINKHIEALEPYDLTEIIIDDFKSEADRLLEKLEKGDSLYIEEPPRDFSKFSKIQSYTRKNDIKLFVKGAPVEDTLFSNLVEEVVKSELAKRLHK